VSKDRNEVNKAIVLEGKRQILLVIRILPKADTDNDDSHGRMIRRHVTFILPRRRIESMNETCRKSVLQERETKKTDSRLLLAASLGLLLRLLVGLFLEEPLSRALLNALFAILLVGTSSIKRTLVAVERLVVVVVGRRHVVVGRTCVLL